MEIFVPTPEELDADFDKENDFHDHHCPDCEAELEAEFAAWMKAKEKDGWS